MPLLPQVAISLVRILYQFWLQNGVPKEVLDDVLKIDISDPRITRFGISSHKLTALHMAANGAVNDRVLGVRLGHYVAEKDLILEKLITYSDSLYHSLGAMVEHSKVVSESGYFTFIEQKNGRYALKYRAHDKINFTSHQRDMVFSGIVAAIEKVHANCNEFIYYHYDQQAAELHEYQDVLSCHLIADEDVYLEFDVELLMAMNAKKDSKLLQKTIYEINKIALKREQRLELYIQVTESIKECLLSGNSQQEVVAEKLGISVRNLQRRLKEVGTNYQTILDDCREVLALKLINDDTLALYEVAYKVGFNEPSAFYKAFKRWTGKRPGDYRKDAMKSQTSEVLNADV
jgi:AraC-like DNA-binding protein